MHGYYAVGNCSPVVVFQYLAPQISTVNWTVFGNFKVLCVDIYVDIVS